MSGADIRAGRAFVELFLKDKLTTEIAGAFQNATKEMGSFVAKSGVLAGVIEKLLPSNLVNAMAQSIAKAGHAVADMVSNVGTKVTLLGGATSAAGIAMSAAFLKPIHDASDLAETLSKFEVVFGAQSAAVMKWGNAFAAQVGRSKQQVASFLAGAQDLFVPLGFAPGAAQNMSKEITKLAIDLASFNNMEDSDSMRDLQAALTGSGEVMKKYGVIVSETAVKNKLLTQGFKIDEATEQQKVMARWELILAGTTAAQGDAIRTAGGWANQNKKLMGTLSDLSASIGKALLPVLTPILEKVNEFATSLSKWIEENPEVVRGVAAAAAGLVAFGAAIATAGAALIAAGSAVGVFMSIFSTIGTVVSSVVMPLLTLGALIVSIFGVAPIVAFIGMIGSAIASTGILATVFLPLAGIMAATTVVVGSLVAGMAALAVAAVSGAVAFYKLADPIKNLKPVAQAAFDAIKNISKALFVGDFAGAADAAISSVKTIFLRGSLAIVEMFQTALARLPTAFSSFRSSFANVISIASDYVKQVLAELGPAAALAFNTFLSIAGDVFDQLPALAGYAFGRIVRATVQAMVSLQNWIVSSYLKIINGMISAAVSLGPKILKAMFTGNVKGLAKEISAIFAMNAGLISGLADGAMPEMKLSGESLAGIAAMADKAGGAVSGLKTSLTEAVTADTAKNQSDKKAVTKGKQTVFEHSPLEKYSDKLEELTKAFKTSTLTASEFAAGIKQLKKETLGIEGTPLEQFRDRVILLNTAFKDHVISSREWTEQVEEAKRSILGIDSQPLTTFSERLKTLSDAMKSGAINQVQFADELKKLRQDVFALESNPLTSFGERVRVLNQALLSGAIGPNQWRKEFKKAQQDILGLQTQPLDEFRTRIDLLNQALARGAISQNQWGKEYKKAQQDILGIKPKPIDEFRTRVDLLNKALASGAIGPDQWRKALAQAKTEILGVEVSPLKKFSDAIADLRDKMQGLTPGELSAGLKKAKDEFLGFDSAPIDTYLKRMQQLKEARKAGRISQDDFKKAATEAMPDRLKSIIDNAKTPMQKYAEQMTEAKKYLAAGLIDKRQFAKEEQRVREDTMGAGRVSVSFSAASLIAQGMGGGETRNPMVGKLDKQISQMEMQLTALVAIKDEVKASRPNWRK